MRPLALLLLAALLAFGSASLAADISAMDPEATFETREQLQRYERLIHELRCLVCQNQTIADSNADLAKDLRRQTRDMILAGRTDAEIQQFMTDRYGDFVLYNPPVKPTTYLLWGAPVILLLIGAVVMVSVVSRKAGESTDGSDGMGENT
jgi:cytochrome c-type biogenesis protein CcmH